MFSVKPECNSGNNSECNLVYTVEGEVKVEAPTPPPGLDIKPIQPVDSKVGFVLCHTCKYGWAFSSSRDEVLYIDQGYIEEEPEAQEGCEI